LAHLRSAAQQQLLTDTGRLLLERLEIIAEDARGRYGDLSPRGVQEHRAIAGRMVEHYPEVFALDSGEVKRVVCHATLVPRCIMSMVTFAERIKETYPQLSIEREASQRWVPYLSPKAEAKRNKPKAVALLDSLVETYVQPEPMMRRIFATENFLSRKEALEMLTDLYHIEAALADVDHLHLSLREFFLPSELERLWACHNIYYHHMIGPSAKWGDALLREHRILLKQIIDTAQSVIDDPDTQLVASLRFGHDVNISPLAALLGVKVASGRAVELENVSQVWQADKVSPMATNIQFIFYRNSQNDVRVRVLYNEQDAEIPLSGGPYYPWKQFYDYCRTLCNE
jgi:hypothetical protein